MSQFIDGYTKDCVCTVTIKMVNRVHRLLLNDMFDMKLQNDKLTLKTDRLEQMFQEKFSISVSSATQGKKTLTLCRTKVVYFLNKVPRN